MESTTFLTDCYACDVYAILVTDALCLCIYYICNFCNVGMSNKRPYCGSQCIVYLFTTVNSLYNIFWQLCLVSSCLQQPQGRLFCYVMVKPSLLWLLLLWTKWTPCGYLTGSTRSVRKLYYQTRVFATRGGSRLSGLPLYINLVIVVLLGHSTLLHRCS